ncbi:MAG TPA: beta-ketoacyl synthase N-terminal-like domain-containing protein [Streptosporangiaceae bacterium]|nr:beta-ketoacyl synthase N-terminal-like domain-containing protein [Streptosporangiaceae bacterium]
MSQLAVTGYAVHVPALGGEGVCDAEHAATLLGRKGLLAKDQATRLALCAVHRALGRPPLAPRPDGPPDPGVAVVVSSNLGNVSTVAAVARLLRTDGPRAVSLLDAPNASSNVIAGAIAIWFRFSGPNFTVCSGATAGLDAVWLAGLLLRAGRARQVVVVGTEPDDPDAAALQAARAGVDPPVPLRAGAACLLLCRPADASAPLAMLRTSADPALPGSVARGYGESVSDHYGAAGVIDTALAVAAGMPTRVVCGDSEDGWRELWVSQP